MGLHGCDIGESGGGGSRIENGWARRIGDLTNNREDWKKGTGSGGWAERTRRGMDTTETML